MTLQIELPDETRRKLEVAASQRGLQPAEYALDLLQRHLGNQKSPQDARDLLQSWIDKGDADEQRKVYNFLTQAIDEDRSSDRKLFPPELNGVTW